ncbi:MAG: transketolase [Nitrospinota bacterium]|nr:transketolase [Nitrospinota bacterium]
MIEKGVRTGNAGSNLPSGTTFRCLREIERKVLWLACWTIHNANHLRPTGDGLKVGGHQASSASVATLMTALFMNVRNPEDRVAVKPHASPIFHAIQCLLGNQTKEKLENFRGLGGAQAYPSRTKDTDEVDFSTGSVGLGVGVTLFASLVQDYVRLHRLAGPDPPTGRMVAVLGDAELDEGNIYEALLEGWKQDVRNLWWVIDYNRQSLDAIIKDFHFRRVKDLFESVGWKVVTLKYGKRLQAAFEGPAGEAPKRWIDDCPNQLYSALTFKGGAAWREHLLRDLKGARGLKQLLESHDNESLQQLMTNLGGHDMEAILEAFHRVEDDTPHCFIAYAIKGFGLPLAGHKDNHAGLMTIDQMSSFRQLHRVPEGEEWNPTSGLDMDSEAYRRFLEAVPFNQRGPKDGRRTVIPVGKLPTPAGKRVSTQTAFGRILSEVARRDDELARRIVTASPDVTVSTNLGGWINLRGVFHRQQHADVFRDEDVGSALKWEQSPKGQHVELGISENNLFLLLAALGLSHDLFGARLLPVGALYDSFIQRGLDALNYSCYQDARFLLVATPSGITLAPEGGAHQSIATPLIGMAQDGLAAFEPAFTDELAAVMEWSLEYIQRDGNGRSETNWLRDIEGGSVYLRLSSRSLNQPDRVMTEETREAVINDGYWLKPPADGAEVVIAYAGALAPEAIEAHRQILDDVPEAGLLAVTSADRLNAGWNAAEQARQSGNKYARSHIERLLSPLAADAGIVTVLDGHPATVAWLGSVHGHKMRALGVEHFGESGDLGGLYRNYRIDTAAILDACTAVCLDQVSSRPVSASRRDD